MNTPLICITTFNEAESIHTLVRSLARLGGHVLVIDGGSWDGTQVVAAHAGAQVVGGLEKRGIGTCLMEGWRIALAKGHDGVIQIDAGGSHNPDDVLHFVERAAMQDKPDVIIGSRFRSKALYNNVNGDPYRPSLSKLAAWMMNYTQSGAHYSDWTSGFRYFNRKALELLIKRDYITDMHTWQIEVLAYAGEVGLHIVEVPISYTAGRSSFNRKIAYEAFTTWLHVMNHVGWVGSKLHHE